jgi:hypothetical protein
MPQLDHDTQMHLSTWLARHVSAADRRDTLRKIMRALAGEPDLIDRNYSWGEMAARGH